MRHVRGAVVALYDLQDTLSLPFLGFIAGRLPPNWATLSAVPVRSVPMRRPNRAPKAQEWSDIMAAAGVPQMSCGRTSAPIPASPIREDVSGQELVRRAPMERMRVGLDEYLVYFPLTGQYVLFPRPDLDLVRGCKRFATLQAHAEAICRSNRFPAEDRSRIEDTLAGFARAGYLLDYQALIQRAITRARNQPDPPGISAIGCVVTRRATPPHRWNPPTVIIDCRPVPDEALAQDSGGALYAGPEEIRRFAGRLAAAGLDPEQVDFALSSPKELEVRSVAGRNALLLETAGQVLFCTGDDAVEPVFGTSGPDGRGLRSFGESNPSESQLFESRAAALACLLPAAAPLPDLHGGVLGAQLEWLLDRFTGEKGVALDHLCLHLARALNAGGGRILLSFNGVLSARGSVSVLASGSATPHRPSESGGACRCAASGTEVLYAVRQLTVCDSEYWPDTAFGADNRELLPPFPPISEGAGRVFARLTRECVKGAFFAHIPAAVVRSAPASGGVADGTVFPGNVRPSLADSLVALIGLHSLPGAPDPAGRMRSIGRHLAKLAALPRAGFEELLKLELWARTSAEIESLERTLNAGDDLPADFARDVKARIAALEDGMQSAAGQETLPDSTQRLVSRYGRLLEQWPAMVEAARSSEPGARIARKVRPARSTA
jgi:hypothetical protein